MPCDALDEAYERLRATGPEFDGWLSNHGPMAAEALARHGHHEQIGVWVDSYSRRLETPPPRGRGIEDWRVALGDARRLGDWLGCFDELLRVEPWTEVLRTWWPRLLPGIAAGATHGVIRTGHAVRVLREDGETGPRIDELAQALGYWAARWQPVPGAASPAGRLPASEALGAVPPIRSQSGGINERLAQLERTRGWVAAQHSIEQVDEAQQFLRDLVVAAVRRYATHAHGNPVMLVHAATAPNAVLRTLPSLPRELWASSAAAAWSSSAAIFAAYGPSSPAPAPIVRGGAADTFARAVDHGDEHVIKLADTALDVHGWTGDRLALGAVEAAASQIELD